MTLILRVTSTSPRLPLSQLVRLPMGLDVWEVRPDYAVARASEAQAERLRQLGYGVEQLRVTEEYLSTFATAEAAALYHSAETLEQDLRRLAEQRPEIAELREIGRSLEKRPIWALRIGERKESTHKVLFLGCHHAREWISVEVPYLLAQHLVEHADEVEQWLTRGEIWVVPMVNPDGHEYSRTTPTQRLWRKNRRPNPDGSWGVDLNRNHGYMWGILNTNTSSHTPADDTYVGSRAFSEPETCAIRDLVGRVSFGGIVTYHSYSQLILWPWGYTGEPINIDEDRNRMANLATRMREVMQSVHGTVFEAKQSSKLYPTAGDTTDWTYGIYGIPSLTIELRPRTWAEGGFILPPSQIQPTWEENKPAALEFIRHVLEEDAGPAWSLRQGDDEQPALSVRWGIEKGQDAPVSDSQIEAIEVLRAAGAFVRLDEFGNAIGLEWGRHARITEAGLKLMATLQSLTWVDLTGMTDAWLRYAAQLLNLRRLCFGVFGSVTDAGMTHLVGLTRLQYLGLEHTDVTLAGLKHLSNLTQLTTLTVPDSIGLEYVLLFPNLEHVYNFGAKDADLGFLVGLSRLKALGIESAAITDAGLEHLGKLTSLAELYLFGTRITEDGFARLRKALPNCQIDDGLAGRGSYPEPAWQRVRLASRRSE